MSVDTVDEDRVTAGRVSSRSATAAALVPVTLALGLGLRLWRVGSNQLTFDEAFTASAATRSLADLFDHLRERDSHPPLDYLLRIPVADSGSELLLRLPSVLLSIATLVVLHRWMRAKGTLGPATIVLAAVSPFWLVHGREARMYALLLLAGVVAGRAGERWLRTGHTSQAITVGVACLVATLSHSLALVFVASMFLLPGLRRDRAAWEWRASIGGSVLGWAALWGTSFLVQADSGPASWIPATTPSVVAETLTQLVNYRSATAAVIVPALIAGGALLARTEPVLARLAVFAFVLPSAVVAVVGIEYHVLLTRALAFGAWVPLVALAAVGRELVSRFGRLGGALALAVVAVFLVAPGIERISGPPGPRPVLDELSRVAGPGDEAVVDPPWLSPLLDWDLRASDAWASRSPDGYVFTYQRIDGEPSGRRWLVSNVDAARSPAPTAPRCAPDRTIDDFRLVCLRIG